MSSWQALSGCSQSTSLLCGYLEIPSEWASAILHHQWRVSHLEGKNLLLKSAHARVLGALSEVTNL